MSHITLPKSNPVPNRSLLYNRKVKKKGFFKFARSEVFLNSTMAPSHCQIQTSAISLQKKKNIMAESFTT